MPFTILNIKTLELQCSPFLDTAQGHNEYTSSYFNFKDGYYSFGMTFNIFPAHWKTLEMNAGFGIDAVKFTEFLDKTVAKNIFNIVWRNDPLYEISVGIGLFY